MKKLITIIMLTITIPSYATTMCAANDSVAVVLDPTIDGTSTVIDTNAETWKTLFSYGYVTGIFACLNSNHGRDQGGWVENLTDTDNNGETKTVTGSERYGRYCWCKAIHPVTSRWVFVYSINTGCASGCAYTCAEGFRSVKVRRNGLFGSMIQ